VIDQGGLPGSAFSIAEDINNLGQAAGEDYVDGTDNDVEWSGGNIINRGVSALFEGQERLLWIAVSPGSKPGVLTVTARVDQAQRASLNRRAAVSIRPRGAGIRRAGGAKGLRRLRKRLARGRLARPAKPMSSIAQVDGSGTTSIVKLSAVGPLPHVHL
jgi:hypothetical protein